MTRKKKQEAPPEDTIDPIVPDVPPTPVPVWEITWDEPQRSAFEVELLRQIAAGQTPEGQRLNRDQLMALAARVLGDA